MKDKLKAIACLGLAVCVASGLWACSKEDVQTEPESSNTTINYVYNGMAMNAGAWETVSYNNSQINNLNVSFLKTGFQTRQYLSDYYVENASFLKLDNLSLTYNVGKISKWASLTVSALVQNVFTITGYSGTDPEVPNGMDKSFYPRPRTYSLSFGLQF